jgi:hypothetical protein
MSLPYGRRPGVVSFGQAKVLNVAALQDRWRPWLTMETAETTHLIANNCYMIWNHVVPADRDDILSRPWFSMQAAGGLRPFVVSQARTTDYLQESDSCPSSMKEFRDTWSGWLHGDDPLRKLQVTAMLGSITATLPLTQTPDPDPTEKDALVQHYCYERAKALRMRDLQHAASGETMEYLAANSVDPALRMLAQVHLITYSMRHGASPEKLPGYVAGAEPILAELGSLPPWLALTVENRLQRILAFYYLRRKDHDAVLNALERATELDGQLKQHAAGSPILTHVWAECHRLLLEIQVRYHTWLKHPVDKAAHVIAELDEIEPYYADSRSAVAELFEVNARFAEAAQHYEDAAAGGTVTGALSAFHAYKCHTASGNSERAVRALHMLTDLDPAADISPYLSS